MNKIWSDFVDRFHGPQEKFAEKQVREMAQRTRHEVSQEIAPAPAALGAFALLTSD
jgi:hypothetical protein